MKILVNLIILSAIAAGGFYFYKQNESELNNTLDSVKNVSVESLSESISESVTKTVIDQARKIDTDELLELVEDNKELINTYLEENNINLDKMDADTLKEILKDQNISLDNINMDELKNKLKL